MLSSTWLNTNFVLHGFRPVKENRATARATRLLKDIFTCNVAQNIGEATDINYQEILVREWRIDCNDFGFCFSVFSVFSFGF